jgi:hypothetical protein
MSIEMKLILQTNEQEKNKTLRCYFQQLFIFSRENLGYSMSVLLSIFLLYLFVIVIVSSSFIDGKKEK